MGQAKNRGTQADRIAQAQAKAKETDQAIIAEARAAMELPADTPFRGFVVHVPEADDYLAVLEDLPSQIVRRYTKLPEQALRFSSCREAEKVCGTLPKRAVVGVLFETEKQFVVCFQDR